MKTRTLQLAIVGAGLVLAAQSNAAIATQWDIVGNWNIEYGVEDGIGALSFTVLSEDIPTGTFSAWDNNHNQAFSGILSGSDINFTDYQIDNNGFGPFSNVLSIEGSIDANGTMSGPMDQANGGTDWTGSFFTLSGDATFVAAPEPATYGIIAGAGLLVVSLGGQFHRKQA